MNPTGLNIRSKVLVAPSHLHFSKRVGAHHKTAIHRRLHPAKALPAHPSVFFVVTPSGP
jgi:hypothetical protein